jgi:hypothetical protein
MQLYISCMHIFFTLMCSLSLLQLRWYYLYEQTLTFTIYLLNLHLNMQKEDDYNVLQTMLPQCYKYKFLKFHELQQKMKFCLEVQQQMWRSLCPSWTTAQAVHSAWRVTGQNEVTSVTFSPDLMDPLYLSQSIQAGQPNWLAPAVTWTLGITHRNASILMQFFILMNNSELPMIPVTKLSFPFACTLPLADTDKTMWRVSVWQIFSYLRAWCQLSLWKRGYRFKT